MYHSYTSEENELLIKQRELGKSWRDIGKLFPRRHWATLMHQYYRLIKNYPPTVDGSRVYNYWTPGEDERLVEAKELGFTWKEIAELFDNERSQESLSARYQLFKGPSKTQKAVKRIPYSPEDDKRLLEAVEADFTWREIAELFDGQRAVHSLKTRFKTLKADNKSISGYVSEEGEILLKSKGRPFGKRLANYLRKGERTVDLLMNSDIIGYDIPEESIPCIQLRKTHVL